MKIENTAFIIPVHPPKYDHIYNLINTLKEHHIRIDVYLVLSDNKDYELFSLKQDIKPIIVYGDINENSIITFKKFYGLKYLMNSAYDYFIVCDSEVDVIPDNFTSGNVTDKLSSIFTNKKIYAGDISQIEDEHTQSVLTSITKVCSSLFSIDEYEHLRHVTNDFNLYFWWSDIPVYKREHLQSFFDKIDYTNIVYRHYDHVIYQCYLILTEQFQIVDTTPITNTKWSLEMLDTTDKNILSKLLEIQYGFGWVTKKMFILPNMSFLMVNNVLLVYHLDR